MYEYQIALEEGRTGRVPEEEAEELALIYAARACRSMKPAGEQRDDA